MICIHVYAPIKKYLKHTGLYLKLRSPIKVENMFTQQTEIVNWGGTEKSMTYKTYKTYKSYINELT